MSVSYYSGFRRRLVASCASLAWICILLATSQKGLAAQQASGQTLSLQSIQELVARNENLASLIKMDYTVRFNQSIPPSEIQPPSLEKYKRRMGRPYSHYSGVWAQDGVRQHSDNNYFYAPDEPARADIFVIDGEVMKWGKKPDLMQGGINYMSKFRWPVVGPTHLGLRPFDGKHLLSDILVPEYAFVHDKTEIVDGRETHVVDVKSPTPVKKGRVFGQIWIDCERGTSLRLEYYHATSAQPTLMTEIKSIKLHQLPNGGWIPVEGTRVSHRLIPKPYARFSHIAVDVNSITIRREDIPDSLFTLSFPEGARVYNAITGITTEGGRVWDPRLDAIIEESTEKFDFDVAPEAASQRKQKSTIKDSQQTTSRASPNEPIESTEPNTAALLNTHPTSQRGFCLVWILLPAFLAAVALTTIVLIFRSRSKNTAGQMPNEN